MRSYELEFWISKQFSLTPNQTQPNSTSSLVMSLLFERTSLVMSLLYERTYLNALKNFNISSFGIPLFRKATSKAMLSAGWCSAMLKLSSALSEKESARPSAVISSTLWTANAPRRITAEREVSFPLCGVVGGDGGDVVDSGVA